MQEQEQKQAIKKSLRDRFLLLIKFLGIMWHTRFKPEGADELGVFLDKEAGAPQDAISLLKNYATAWREARKDFEHFLHIDRYLIGGISIANLILLQAMLSIGVPDTLSFIALVALAISLPLASGSLFFSFLKKENNITTYGKIHDYLSSCALFTGVIAIAATILHVSRWAGIVFICSAVVVFLLCGFFTVIVAARKHWPKPPKPSGSNGEISNAEPL